MSPSILRPLCAILAAFLLTGCLFDYPVSSPVETTAEAPEDVEDPEEEEDPSYIVICVRKQTRIRVAYRPCDDAEPGFAWYFTPMEGKVPATGRRAEGGSFYFTGSEKLRARKKGGDAAKAVIRSDEPGDNMSTRAPVCTWTTNGRCNNGNTANGCGHSSFNRVCGYGRGPVRP